MNARITQAKRCGRCGEEKQLSSRFFTRRMEPGYSHLWRSACNKCRTEQRAEASRRARERNAKICSTCEDKTPQPLENFYVRSSAYDGRQNQCKLCEAVRHGLRKPGGQPGEKPGAWKKGAFCNTCFGLPWRVYGARCCECKLEHAAEPPVELVTRKSPPDARGLF
jgi:hypothetical protein